jgi:peptidoglycan LD-endopeptidase LytH
VQGKKLSLAIFTMVGLLGGPSPVHTDARAERVRGFTPRTLPPVITGGRAFPVARTNYYSVINFTDDWHDPRMRFEDGRWRQIGAHEGCDIFAEPGTPVYSITAGTIENVGWTFYSGWRVGVRDDQGRYWFYAHLSKFAPGIVPGVTVGPGDRLGRVGNTGYGNRPGHSNEFTWHLHVGIQEADGTWVNPYPLLKELYESAVRERA